MDGLKVKKLTANLTPSAKKRSNMKKGKVISVKVEGAGTFTSTAKVKKGKKRIKVGGATFYGSKKSTKKKEESKKETAKKKEHEKKLDAKTGLYYYDWK